MNFDHFFLVVLLSWRIHLHHSFRLPPDSCSCVGNTEQTPITPPRLPPVSHQRMSAKYVMPIFFPTAIFLRIPSVCDAPCVEKPAA